MFRYTARTSRRWAGLALATGLLVQTTLGGNAAHAEGFVDPAFEAQWRTTDANRAGRTNQTYFWGPEAFTHTNEVYVEGANGQRRVQYFDKARMELTARTGQPSAVTNGLLTVELVSGRMQIGDNRFIDHTAAAVVVAGDPLGNERAPTYASFNAGRLAYGVAGAQPATQRSGQPVVEAVDRTGAVSTITPPTKVTYSRYFSQTGHNVADVFDAFFRSAPLSEATWLDVMGYPISEPFWAKDKVVVGGQQRDVLVQLFQRRALTFTPSNPAAYQIEMGNIGQHYYSWRYGSDGRDRLPGNYRMINAVGRDLFSTSVRNSADRVQLGTAPDTITKVWALSESRAVFVSGGKAYLADLRRARPFVALPGQDGTIEQVIGSADGRFIAVRSKAVGGYVQLISVGTLADDNIAIRDARDVFSGNAVTMRFARTSRFLAITKPSSVTFVDTTTGGSREIAVTGRALITRMEWIGATERVLVSTGGSDATSDQPKVEGAVIDIDAVSGASRTLMTEPYIRNVLPSPDGKHFAVLSIKGDFYVAGQPNSLWTSIVRVRSLDEASRDVMPAYEQGTPGRYSYEPTLETWSADGTYLTVRSSAGGTGGGYEVNTSLVNIVTGTPITQFTTQGYSGSFTDLQLVAPFTILERTSEYKGPDAQVAQTIRVTNVDGSDARTVLTDTVAPNTPTSNQAVETAQIVQVVVPE